MSVTKTGHVVESVRSAGQDLWIDAPCNFWEGIHDAWQPAKPWTLGFDLADFRADSGPAIAAVGPKLAVNSNAPGQTASVQVRDFRVYTNGG